MKIARIVAAVMCGCMLIIVISACDGDTATTPTYDPTVENGTDVIDGGVLLYLGYREYWGGRYANFTDADLDRLTAMSNDFVLINYATYNWVEVEGGENRPVITTEDVMAINPDDTGIRCFCGGEPNWELMLSWGFDEVPAQGCNFLWEMWHYARKVHWMNEQGRQYTFQSYVREAVSLTERLVERNPDVNVWVSLPATEHLHLLTHLYTEYWIEYIVRETERLMPPEIWENNVRGFYYGNEQIVAFYTPYSVDEPIYADTSYLENTVVQGMRRLSDVIRGEMNRQFLWIPTVNINCESFIIVGYIANRLNIFDAILMQPAYYFMTPTHPEQGRGRIQLQVIYDSVRAQAVLNPQGVIVGGSKDSITHIGVLMEVDERIIHNNYEHLYRYEAYVEQFKPLFGDFALGFYAGCPLEVRAIMDTLEEFLGERD